jgi:hypothetical protein
VVEFNVSWKSEPIKAIIIDQKTRFIDGNKKFLVGKLTNILENDWSHLGEPLIRRTIKKYIDGISI